MDVLRDGGNAVDASVTAAFVLQIVEPHLNGPAGELVALLHGPQSVRPTCLSGVGPAPRAATREAFMRQGMDLVPGTGVLSAPIPGQFHALTTLLETQGTLSLGQVLQPAASVARFGFPVTPSLHEALRSAELGIFRHDPKSARHWIPRGVPVLGSLMKNIELANLFDELIAVSKHHPSRSEGIAAARHHWYRGPVAEAIHAHATEHGGLLTYDDVASYQSTFEDPIVHHAGEHTFVKAGLWTQGAVLPMAWDSYLASGGPTRKAPDPHGLHELIESIRLAMADRDSYFGDGASCQTDLLTSSYAESRAAEISAAALVNVDPGIIPGLAPWVPPTRTSSTPLSQSPWAPERTGRGDTCHVSIITADGTGVSLTASGGWFQSSPVVTSLGFALSTRLQQTWLDAASPSAMTPGKRPRVTLTPTLVLEDNEVRMALGSPGGDGQDQWQLHALVRILLLGQSLEQAAADYTFQSISFNNSFWPRESVERGVLLERRAPRELARDLENRGHRIFDVPGSSLGRLSIVARATHTGDLGASVSPRSGYALAALG